MTDSLREAARGNGRCHVRRLVASAYMRLARTPNAGTDPRLTTEPNEPLSCCMHSAECTNNPRESPLSQVFARDDSNNRRLTCRFRATERRGLTFGD